MGRAYEVRKASIQKTGAAKAKVYSMYAREIYLAAKGHGTDLNGNLVLKRLVDKAKKEQVPADIINRAIEKVNSGMSEDYTKVRYEIFGPGSSTLLVDCLTDNLNRSVSNIRTVLNKTKTKMGVSGSVSFMYDNLSVISFKGMTLEEVLNILVERNIDVVDIEEDDGITIYGRPQDLYKIKEAILDYKTVDFTIEEIITLPKETIVLMGEDLDNFNHLLGLLEDIDDVQNVYHNVVVE